MRKDNHQPNHFYKSNLRPASMATLFSPKDGYHIFDIRQLLYQLTDLTIRRAEVVRCN
jgi:hypothetical protein